MKILLINSVCGQGSTGRICVDIARQYKKEGHTVKIAYGRDGYVPEHAKEYAVRIGSDYSVRFDVLYTRVMDKHGLGMKRETARFLKWVEEYQPDLIWLHNLHGYYINYEMLFDWIKEHPDVKVKWTLHDCWAFTGQCAHFTAINCDKWKSQCERCENKKKYPKNLIFDNSKDNFNRKKAAFTGVKDMTLIVPSHWLEGLVLQSFLKEYPVEVQYNKIDSRFVRTESDFRERYQLEDKKIVLGVANIWDENKGLGDFAELAGMLDDSYKIVLVGQIKDKKVKLPEKVLAVGQTKSLDELVKAYSAADYFVNPSVGESFGMTTAEAARCGAKVIVYNVSACEEIAKMYGGIAVEPGIRNIYDAIKQEG